MGDRIWGYDSVGAKRVLTTVRGVTSNVATTTLLFGGTLRVTGNLPVYANVEWKRANAVAPNVVDIKGAGGQTRKNVHFTKQWPGKSWLYTRYDPGTQLGDRVVGRMTVNNVATVDARVLSSKFSTEVHYMYTEVEKTKGITRRIEEVKPLIPFRVRNSALGAGSGKVLVLENQLKYPVYKVGVRVTSAGGAAVGEFVKPKLDPGSTMDVGSWQDSRNLVVCDSVTVWIGEGFLVTTILETAPDR